MKPSAFLRGLWPTVSDQHRIQIWRLADRKTFLIRAADAGDYYAHGQTDIYTSVCLTHPAFKGGRPGIADSRALTGLWLDIDVDGGPHNKTGGLPNLQAAIQLAGAILEPTLMVCSGYGLHAWHLFPTPWLFRTVDDQKAAALAAAQWYHLHRQKAAQHGWGLDHTHDLARLLRLPGSINGKGGQQAPVYALDHRGPRTDRHELLALAATGGPILHGVAAGDGPAVTVVAGQGIDQARLDALLEDPALAAVFHHRNGQPHWSLSEYDMSIASTLVRAGGWTDQQIADVLVAHRHHHGETSKAGRARYLQVTISNARASQARRQNAAAQLELLGRRAA